MTGFRATVRSLLREKLLDAAYELVVSGGWARARMADIAAAVGVSRQTVYNEFGSKPALAEALALRETERFLVGVQERLDASPADFTHGVAAAVEYALRRAAGDPLLKAVLTSERGGGDSELLALVTIRAEPILRAASQMLRGEVAARWPDAPVDDVAFVVDSVVRLVVSHIVLPLDPPEATGRRLARMVVGGLGVAPARRPGAAGTPVASGSPVR